MHRRQILVLGVGGAFSTVGCLRLTDDGRQEENVGGDDSADTGSGSGGGAVYSTREEAIEHVSSFASEGGQSPGTAGDASPESITFSTSGSGSSSTTGDDGETLTSEDLRVGPLTDDAIRFDSSRAIRVRNLAVGSSLTFEPEEGLGTYDIDRINVDPGGDGTLRDRAPELSVANEDTVLESPGEWTGDREIFTRQPVARYVVELLENGSVIGRTEEQSLGTGYRWAIDQTRDAAFVTRHPGIRDDWHVEFTLGQSRFDPIERLPVTQLAGRNAFEIDLTLSDVEPDEYDWRLRIAEEEGAGQDVIGLRSVFGNTLFVE